MHAISWSINLVINDSNSLFAKYFTHFNGLHILRHKRNLYWTAIFKMVGVILLISASSALMDC